MNKKLKRYYFITFTIGVLFIIFDYTLFKQSAVDIIRFVIYGVLINAIYSFIFDIKGKRKRK